MQKTIIKNAHVISPDVDIENATIVIEGKIISKIGEGRPDVLDAIKNREVKLIINTPSGRRDARADDCRIRQAAIKYKVPYLTTLAAAKAAAEGIKAAREGKGEVRSLQSYHISIGA